MNTGTITERQVDAVNIASGIERSVMQVWSLCIGIRRDVQQSGDMESARVQARSLAAFLRSLATSADSVVDSLA